MVPFNCYTCMSQAFLVLLFSYKLHSSLSIWYQFYVLLDYLQCILFIFNFFIHLSWFKENDEVKFRNFFFERHQLFNFLHYKCTLWGCFASVLFILNVFHYKLYIFILGFQLLIIYDVGLFCICILKFVVNVQYAISVPVYYLYIYL